MCLVVTALFSAVLASCKVTITVPKQGKVTSESGLFNCEGGSKCEFEVSDTNFDETFIAKAKGKYSFAGWRRDGFHLCSGSVSRCRLDTVQFAGNEAWEAFLKEDGEFFMEPVFLEWLNWQRPIKLGKAPRKQPSLGKPAETAVIDFDKDGDLDVIIFDFVHPWENIEVPILFLGNDGSGNFTDVTYELFPEGGPTTIVTNENLIADFNGDGIEDFFIAETGPDGPQPNIGATNSLLLGTRDGLVDASANLPNLKKFSHSATYGDIDSDGDLDIYVGNFQNAYDVAFYINDGKANFSHSLVGNHLSDFVSVNQTGAGRVMVAWTRSHLFDADNDGDVDLVGGGGGVGLGGLDLFINNGRGVFTFKNNAIAREGLFNYNARVTSIENADLNGDGAQDLLVIAIGGYGILRNEDWIGGGRFFVFINNGDGTFRDETELRVDKQAQYPVNGPRTVLLIDLDGDKDKDVVMRGAEIMHAAYINDGNGRFFLNHGVADLAIYTQISGAQIGAHNIEVGDFDGDGNVDIFGIGEHREMLFSKE